MCVCVCVEPDLAEFGLCDAAGPAGHVGLVFRGPYLGGPKRTVSTADRVEGQPGRVTIHRTAGTHTHTLVYTSFISYS